MTVRYNEYALKATRYADRGLTRPPKPSSTPHVAEFERHGFRRVALDDVARRAGVSRTTIYRRFANRDELVAAVIERENVALFADIAAELETGRAAVELLRRGVHAVDPDVPHDTGCSDRMIDRRARRWCWSWRRQHYGAAIERMAEALRVIFPAGSPTGSARRPSTSWPTRSCATRRWCCCCRAPQPLDTADDLRAFATRHFLPSLPAALRPYQLPVSGHSLAATPWLP